MRRHRILLAALAVALAAATPLRSQSYQPKEIVFTGDPAAPKAELLAAAGIASGSTLDNAQMQAAAQRLANTGFFSDVRFSFDGQILNYVLQPATGLLPARFENFPWWEKQALLEAVEAKVPLFHGSLVPESGTQQQIAAVLTALVAEKNVTATVTALPVTDLATGKAVAVGFQIASPAVEVGEIEFAGASRQWAPKLQPITKTAAGQPFGSDSTRDALSTAVRNAYGREGYLDARVARLSQGTPVVTETAIRVPLKLAVEEGEPYRVGKLALASPVLTPKADFEKNAKLHPGDVADQEKLRQSLAVLLGPYKERGYLRAKADAVPTRNAWQHTVDYTITVEQGDVFHMGKVEVENLDEQRRAEFLRLWGLKPGEVYNASYAPEFLKKNAGALHGLDGYSASYKQFEHEDTHVVDLLVSFRRDAALN